VFTYENYKKAFKVAGLVPINAQRVINRLKVRLCTLLLVTLLETLWQSRTLSNTYEFRSQLKLIREAFVRLLISA
jgi:hypothetical protein